MKTEKRDLEMEKVVQKSMASPRQEFPTKKGFPVTKVKPDLGGHNKHPPVNTTMRRSSSRGKHVIPTSHSLDNELGRNSTVAEGSLASSASDLSSSGTAGKMLSPRRSPKVAARKMKSKINVAKRSASPKRPGRSYIEQRVPGTKGSSDLKIKSGSFDSNDGDNGPVEGHYRDEHDPFESDESSEIIIKRNSEQIHNLKDENEVLLSLRQALEKVIILHIYYTDVKLILSV